MRQTDDKEIAFNIRFALGQAGNSLYQTLAGGDHVRRAAAAKHLCERVLAPFRKPMFFDANSMSIEPSDIEALICGAMLELGPLTYNAARNGHQQTRRDAHSVIARRVMERMGDIEILVSDPSTNIFSDRVGKKRL